MDFICNSFYFPFFKLLEMKSLLTFIVHFVIFPFRCYLTVPSVALFVLLLCLSKVMRISNCLCYQTEVERSKSSCKMTDASINLRPASLSAFRAVASSAT
jgi:hypothetical protein